MLDLISKAKHLSGYQIPDKIRYKAKVKYEKKEEMLSSDRPKIEREIHLKFSDEITVERQISFSEDAVTILINSRWLEESLDYPSIMNNFIYVLGFVDSTQMRSSAVGKKQNLTIIDKTRVFSNPKRFYFDSYDFQLRNLILFMQLDAYHQFLEVHQIILEDVLGWVFTQYFQKEFAFPEMRASFPSKQTTYLEKCTSLLTIFDSLLKQYSAYVENGEIDFGLINIATTPISFSAVPSVVKNKYLYGYGDEYKSITYLLFSDQCTLSYVDRLCAGSNKSYDSFFGLLQHEKVFRSDYIDYYNRELEFLEKRNLIRFLEDDQIVVGDYDQVLVLRDLYLNEVVSIHHYPKRFLRVFRKLEERQIVFVKDTLFSTPEYQYLNFLLNRSEFDNGPEIRNNYLHGNQQSNTNEKIHYNNYLIIMSIVILLAIKINDELNIREKAKADS